MKFYFWIIQGLRFKKLCLEIRIRKKIRWSKKTKFKKKLVFFYIKKLNEN
jgi:hypothetical protein